MPAVRDDTIPTQARTVAGIAQLNSWNVNIHADHLTATCPEQTDGVSWQISWKNNTVTYIELSEQNVHADVRQAAAGHAETPLAQVRTARARIHELASRRCLPDTTGRCLCCFTVAPEEAELTNTAAGLCWACHHTHLQLAANAVNLDFIPHPLCVRRAHGVPAYSRELWRLDPRTHITYDGADQINELQTWLRERGAGQAVVVEHNLGCAIGLGEPSDMVTVVSETHPGGWALHQHGELIAISEPARHEVLDWLLDACGVA